MKEIRLTMPESTIDAIVKTYDWYMHLIGRDSEGTYEYKAKEAIEIALATLYMACSNLEAEEKKKLEDLAAADKAAADKAAADQAGSRQQEPGS